MRTTYDNNKEYVPYLILALTAIVATSVLLVIWAFPRIIVSLYKWRDILFSKFRYKQYLKLDNNLSACYVERGSPDTCKTSILLLHGMFGSGASFTGILPKLDENVYHVVALDLLNHGSSTYLDRDISVDHMVNFLRKFVERSGLHRKKFHLFTYSMSTALGVQYAADYPQHLASLVLAAPVCSLIPEISNFDHKFDDSMVNHPSSFMIRAIVDYRNSRGMYTVKVQRGLKTFQFTRNLLQKIQVNTFVLWGDQDKICLTEEGSAILKDNMMKCKVQLIKDCGHDMFTTHLDDVAMYLLEWLANHQR